MIELDKAKEIIKARLSPQRYIHSCNVADEARKLAAKFQVNENEASLAGLMHDYAKGLSGDKLMHIARENKLIKDDIEFSIPDILHASVGAFLLKSEGIIANEDILNAIARHTLGDINMTELDKIIFLADMIEPSRDYPQQQRLHCLAYRNLDEAILFGLESTIKHCLENKRLLHPQTIKVRNEYLRKVNND